MTILKFFQHICYSLLFSSFLVNLNGLSVEAANSVLSGSLSFLDQRNSVNPGSLVYYWSSTQATNIPQLLNLRLALSNPSQPTVSIQLAQAAQISVKCSQNSQTTGSGYVQLSFVSPEVLVNLNATSNIGVQFIIQNSGQSTLVTCAATVKAFQSQTILNQTFDSLQITNPPSIIFRVSDYPTISFSPNQASNTNVQISPFTNSFFEIFFKDQTLNECAVTCSVVSPTTNSALSFPQTTVPVSSGSFRININYDINLSLVRLTDTYTVTCSAQSVATGGSSIPQYQSTIAKATATVSLKSPQVEYLQPSRQILGSDFEIPLKLNPSPPTNSNITLQCGLVRFDSLGQLNAYQSSISANSCPGSLAAAPKPADLSSYTYDKVPFDWYMIDASNSSIQENLKTVFFQVNAQNSLRIERRPSNRIRSNFYVYLSLVCCDIAVTTSQALAYKTRVSNFIVQVTSDLNSTISVRNAPTNDDLLNPAYDPCTCDLTLDYCDMGCCCDRDCSPDDISTFNFKCPVRRRTVFEKSIDRWSCYDIYNRPKLQDYDWFPILCIQFNLTYILGNFYSPNDLDALVADDNRLLERIQTLFASSYNYQSSLANLPNAPVITQPFCSLTPTLPTYVYGQCLIQADSTNQIDYVRFPSVKSALSSCVFDSPLRYLASESSIFCPIKIDSTVCSATSDQLNYVKFVSQQILTSPTSATGQPIQVEYYKCANYPASSTTVRPTGTVLRKCSTDFAVNTRLFDNAADLSACGDDIWVAPSDDDKTETQKISNDYYQDGIFKNGNCQLIQPATLATFTITSQPDRCLNVLAGVRYVFLWKDGVVVRVIARVILTDVVYETTTTPSSFLFKQLFRSEWQYNSQEFDGVLSVQAYDNVINSVTFYSKIRSGTNGYLWGLPIISGFKTSSTTQPAAATIVDTSNYLRIGGQKLLNTVLCGTIGLSEREPIRFGFNTTSICQVQVSRADISDIVRCTNLRRLVFKKLNSYYVPANVVSRNGRPNMSEFVDTDWVSVYPGNGERTFINETSTSLNFSLNTCPDVPYRINVFFFYQYVGKSDGQSVFQIHDASVRYSVTDWSYTCESSDCRSVDEANLPLRSYNLEFRTYFIEINKPILSWLDQCQSGKYPGWSCLQEVFWLWPKDYSADDFFYLYQLNLGVIFGVFGFFIFYIMIIGFVCPC